MADDLIRLDETTRAAVASGRLVHLATINPDGTPQVTCIYVGWDGDEIVAGHLADHVKLRNIRRDPRVTLSVESDVPVEGFSPYVVIKGIARVEVGGAVPVAPTHHPRRIPASWRQLARWICDAHLASARLGNRPVGSRRLSPLCCRRFRVAAPGPPSGPSADGERSPFRSGSPSGRARAPWDENRVGPRGRRVRKANGRGEHVDRPEGGRSVVGDRLAEAVLLGGAGEFRIHEPERAAPHGTPRQADGHVPRAPLVGALRPALRWRRSPPCSR